MSLKLLKADITRFPCDALIISSDSSLMNGGAAYGACYSAAQMNFGEYISNHFRHEISVGNAYLIEKEKANFSDDLKAKNVIVTTAPKWVGGESNEIEQLASCYVNSLEKARKTGAKKIAVSIINSRIFGFPSNLSELIAKRAILRYLENYDLDVYLILHNWKSYGINRDKIEKLRQYIEKTKEEEICFAAEAPKRKELSASKRASLEERVKNKDESFSEMLLRLIDERGMKDSDCYNKANVSRKVFSKIRCNRNYHPKKETALAFALALELDIEGTQQLLRTAGYSLSHSNIADIIVEYHIMNGIFKVSDINEMLYEYDQKLLGTN